LECEDENQQHGYSQQWKHKYSEQHSPFSTLWWSIEKQFNYSRLSIPSFSRQREAADLLSLGPGWKVEKFCVLSKLGDAETHRTQRLASIEGSSTEEREGEGIGMLS
jgi:hypothetical protein